MSRTQLHEFELDGHEWTVVCYTPPQPDPLGLLTASELEVVEAWMAGGSMRSIADARGVTPRTIAKQLASVYQKFGVSSRAELVTLMHDLSSQVR